MTPDKLIELLNYIMQNNSWQNLYVNACEKHRPCFKYIDFSFDTRDGHIWQITFRENGAFNFKEKKTFRIENENDLKEVYKFLDTVYEK